MSHFSNVLLKMGSSELLFFFLHTYRGHREFLVLFHLTQWPKEGSGVLLS